MDNGRSMEQHWTLASKLVEILSWRALGYDEDGMGEEYSNIYILSSRAYLI